jgi:hypothetical protein
MAQAVFNLNQFISHMKALHDDFHPHHPEYSAALENLAKTAVGMQELCKAFWLSAWGSIPDDIDVYRR